MFNPAFIMRTKGSRSRRVATSALFAALTAAGAWVSIPFFPVPLTLQTFFIYLAVLILGRYAFLSQAIYIGMGLVGLPVFARGMSGYGVLVGPTGGFIIGFLVGSLVGGVVIDVGGRSNFAAIASLLACAVCVFGMGWVWLSCWLDWNYSLALWAGVLPFLPGDALKAGLALVVWKKLPYWGV